MAVVSKSSNELTVDKFTGNPIEFSMENRAFNYVSLFSLIILGAYLCFDIYFSQVIMTYVLGVLLFVQSALYYFSRFRKQFYGGVIVYAVCSYSALSINYYVNSGINGPTLSLFFLTLQLLITISKPRFYALWIALHIIIVSILISSEYLHPEWIQNTYANSFQRYGDIYITYIAAISFIFFLTIYLRNHFNAERKLAEERADAISRQNKHILEQNQLLEQVNAEKNKLFSIVSHDLKTPLDSISGYLVLLSENLVDTQEKASLEADLLEQTKYTSDLLLNLLSWAKTQMEGVTVSLTTIAIKKMIEELTGNKMSFAAKKDIKITHSIDPSFEVIGDTDMLRIVMRNLINNAIKFTKAGGEIVIKAYKKGNDAEISVQDTGIGIPVDKHNEIFTLKTRSTYGTNNEKGIGLGLRMCKEFMDYQHGTIRFESKVGQGTIFYICLPAPRL